MDLRVVVLVVIALLGGCSFLPTGGKKEPDRTYILAPGTVPPAAAADARCGSLQVASGSGASGFRSRRMAYMRSDVELQYFAFSRWADAPARLLSEQTRRYLDRSGAFGSVLAAPVPVRTDLTLELTDVMLVQHFHEATSEVHIELDVRVYGPNRAVLLAGRRFELNEPAGSDAHSGVEAANRAVAALLPQMLQFIANSCSGAQQL